MEEPLPVSWGIWFNQVGGELMDQGQYCNAAESFELALSCLLFGSSSFRDDVFSIQNEPLNESGCNHVCEETEGHHFIFGKALLFNGDRVRQASTYNNSAYAVVIYTLRATTLLNLSIALHRAGIAAGNKSGLMTSAKTGYQSTLQVLHAIDRTHAILIGVYAFQNLAILHHSQMEYEECLKCLQSLSWMTHFGISESVLDSCTIGKVTMALFFYSQIPEAAACA